MRPTLGNSPARELASQINTDNLRALELPWNISHDVDSISTTNTARDHSETTSVGGVRVSANHKTTRERIVLEDNLMDNTRARPPETETILKSMR